MAYFHIYNVAWRFFSLKEAKKIFYAHILAYTAFVFLYYLYPIPFDPFPRSVIIIDMFLSMIFIGILRLLKRIIIEENRDKNLKKTMIIGATEYAQTLIKQNNSFCIDTIVDDSRMIIGTYVSNIKVSSFEDIEFLARSKEIESVIITKELEKEILQDIYTKLHNARVQDILLATLAHDSRRLKNLSVEDLLARHPKDLDLDSIENFIKDKSILITGAGGSIGSEIVRQCSRFGAKRLILVDSSEFNLYQIGQQVSQADLRLLNVTETEILDRLFNEVSPDIVIHAAAYKHVPICESNIDAAVKNNIVGTKNVIDCSIKYAVKKVVVISTDKAVRPTNVMGATKRVTELYASNVDAKKTEIVAVRFGNVLGSSGSVIPKFKEQIEAGGPVTVTHPDITRYFMLIPEACQLVLQTATIAKGGELFILDMGEPIKIVDLAKQMIHLYGKEEKVEIVFTGLRAGEKLYEELLLDESEQKTKYNSIYIAKPAAYDITQLVHDINVLLESKNKVQALQKIVPEFTRKGSL